MWFLDWKIFHIIDIWYMLCELCGRLLVCLWFLGFKEIKYNWICAIILIFLKCFLGSFLYGIDGG